MTDPAEPTTPAAEAKLITRLVALLDKADQAKHASPHGPQTDTGRQARRRRE